MVLVAVPVVYCGGSIKYVERRDGVRYQCDQETDKETDTHTHRERERERGREKGRDANVSDTV